MIASGVLGIFVLKAANDGDAAPKIAREICAAVLTLSAATRPFIPNAHVRHPLLQQASSLNLSVRQEDRETKENPNGPPHPANPFVASHSDEPPKVRNM